MMDLSAELFCLQPCARNWLEIKEPVSQGRTLTGPVEKEVRIGRGPGCQWEEEEEACHSLARREKDGKRERS
jgi:hypothetical protein